jgi:Protein of unknown function (DUF3108)
MLHHYRAEWRTGDAELVRAGKVGPTDATLPAVGKEYVPFGRMAVQGAASSRPAVRTMERIAQKAAGVPRRAILTWVAAAIFFAAFAVAGAMGALGDARRAEWNAEGKHVPFAVGETLRYRLGWANFANAADVKLDFVERRELGSEPVFHFRARLRSLPPLRTLFPVDDQFDSYADARTMESRQYEFYLDELGEKETRIRRLATAGAPRTATGPRVIVPAGTRDPLGILYEMRTIDWKKSPDYRALMYDGNDVFEVRAHLEVLAEVVATDAGNFHATRIEARLYQHGAEVPKTEFSMWFANDAARTPVLLDATMPYGHVRAELEPSARSDAK